MDAHKVVVTLGNINSCNYIWEQAISDFGGPIHEVTTSRILQHFVNPQNFL